MSPTTQSLRRFLQAPDKLRLPIMAPLMTAAIFVLMFSVMILVQVFSPVLDAVTRHERTTISALRASFLAWKLDRGALGELSWETARHMDRAVEQRARDDDEIRKGTLRGWALSKPWLAKNISLDAKTVRDLAEKRLTGLSGKAPGWAATARLCEEGVTTMTPGHRFIRDYNVGMTETAKAYTQVLGREIKPADLLPLVPNGRCE